MASVVFGIAFAVFAVFIQSSDQFSVPGGLYPVSVSDPSVRKAAEFATGAISYWDNYPYKTKLVYVKSANAQVVSGKNYEMQILIQETECPRSSNRVVNYCLDLPGRRPRACFVKIHDQPWLKNRHTMTYHQCN